MLQFGLRVPRSTRPSIVDRGSLPSAHPARNPLRFPLPNKINHGAQLLRTQCPASSEGSAITQQQGVNPPSPSRAPQPWEDTQDKTGDLQSLIQAIPFKRLAIWLFVAAVMYKLSDFFGVSGRAMGTMTRGHVGAKGP